MFLINHRAVYLLLAAAYLAVALGWAGNIALVMVVAYTLLGLSKR